jgi:hypothetical protein
MWEKYGTAIQPTDDNIIWRMRISFWIPTATNIHSQYVILTAFPLQQWLQGRASILHYTYIVSLVISVISPQFNDFLSVTSLSSTTYRIRVSPSKFYTKTFNSITVGLTSSSLKTLFFLRSTRYPSRVPNPCSHTYHSTYLFSWTGLYEVWLSRIYISARSSIANNSSDWSPYFYMCYTNPLTLMSTWACWI